MMLKDGAVIAIKDCMKVKRGESVLIVTDTEKFRIGKALFDAAQEIGGEAMLMMMLPRGKHGEEPPEAVAKAMLGADVILAPTARSITHTKARKAACEAGARAATLPGITEEMFSAGGMVADYGQIRKRAEELLKILQGSKEAVIKSGSGTDLTLELVGRRWFADTGICERPGEFTNLPGGEVYISPRSAYGTLVIDGVMSGLGVLRSPITIRVKDGYAVSFEGGRATELEKLLEDSGKAGRNIAELGIGINPSARIIGITLEDEKVAGTLHVALGDDSTIGGDVEAKVHLDGLITEGPRLFVDGKEVKL
jgi:leucyl aminopeptidase (aminopeptidase T)